VQPQFRFGREQSAADSHSFAQKQLGGTEGLLGLRQVHCQPAGQSPATPIVQLSSPSAPPAPAAPPIEPPTPLAPPFAAEPPALAPPDPVTPPEPSTPPFALPPVPIAPPLLGADPSTVRVPVSLPEAQARAEKIPTTARSVRTCINSLAPFDA
jgi:hypothetical protein